MGRELQSTVSHTEIRDASAWGDRLQRSGPIDSCLSWFTVDLFENDQGHVIAVSLDLWEP